MIEVYEGVFVTPVTAALIKERDGLVATTAAMKSALLDCEYNAIFASSADESYRLASAASVLRSQYETAMKRIAVIERMVY